MSDDLKTEEILLLKALCEQRDKLVLRKAGYVLKQPGLVAAVPGGDATVTTLRDKGYLDGSLQPTESGKRAISPAKPRT